MKSQLFLCRSLSIDIGNQVNRTIGFYRFVVYRLTTTGLIVNALVNQLVKVDEIGSGCVPKKIVLFDRLCFQDTVGPLNDYRDTVIVTNFLPCPLNSL